MKTFFILLVILICVAIPVFFLARRQNQRILQSPLEEKFVAGTMPYPLPSGFYEGSVANYSGTWRGKTFDQQKATGINVFANAKDDTQVVQQYPFKTYMGEGLQDPQPVLKIDYNIPENPIWLRLIVDEIVETEPGHYLGKMLVNLIPGHPLTLTWFQ